MKKNLNYLLLTSLTTLFFAGCVTADVENPSVDTGGADDNGYEMGQSLVINAFDANSTSTKAVEDDSSTHFVSGDKIGIFVVIGEHIIQFNECYTMNSQGSWTGEGAYWGDSSSDVHYYAYYPYVNNICFDEIYSLAEGDGGFAYITADEWSDVTTHVTAATGTADGSYPTGKNDFTADANGYYRPDNNRKRSILNGSAVDVESDDDDSRFGSGETYVLQVDYDTVTPNEGDLDADHDDGTRTADYFFSDLVDKWTPRTYQEGTKYTLSDLMICKGYFSQTSVSTYPLTLALRHQMSMMHFEFPSKYKFELGLDGKGAAVAVEDEAAQTAADANAELIATPSTDAYRASLTVYIDPVTKTKNTLGDVVVAGVTDMAAKFHDLTADSSSTYYYSADVDNGDGTVTRGNHNEFRYIIRPHTLYDQDLFDDVSGYSGAQVHIKYSYWDLDENGDADTSQEAISKSFNTIFVPNPNAYVHYMMEDGAIPEGDPTLIRTAGDDHDKGIYPTCVGAFWRHNQSGERIVKIQPCYEEDYGAWRAFVYQMDAGWKETTDIRLDSYTAAVDYLVNDAENYQVTNLSQSISGTCGAESPILFRIGLTDEDFDMTSPVTGAYLPARYATIMLIYAEGTKYQLLYLRQGEDPDYLFHPEDTYTSVTNNDIQRGYASKVSPYNLTAQSWLELIEAESTSGIKSETPSVQLNSTAGGVVEGLYTTVKSTWSDAAFTEFPSQIGAYFQFQTDSADNNLKWPEAGGWVTDTNYPVWNIQRAFPATSTETGVDVHAPAYVWDKTQEVCPKSYLSADGKYEFDFERPGGGRDDIDISVYNGTMSQFGQSLFDNPRFAAGNCLSGYYADGYHDRRSFFQSYSAAQYSSTGILFYNSRDFASVFLPAGSVKSHKTAAIVAPTTPTTTFPACQELGYYWTTSTYDAATYSRVGFILTAPINFSATGAYKDSDPTCSATPIGDATYWHHAFCNIRPFVDAERTVTTTEDSTTTE